jgi:hypothetical protein
MNLKGIEYHLNFLTVTFSPLKVKPSVGISGTATIIFVPQDTDSRNHPWFDSHAAVSNKYSSD